MKYLGAAAVVALGALVASPDEASAQNARVTTDLNMRAGPSTDFPVVDVIPEGAPITVHGGVSEYRWCDATWRDDRGWISAAYITYRYQSRYVPLIEYGPRVAVPIITYSVDTYWNRYYRGRPWYGQRSRWRDSWRSGRRDNIIERRQDRREGRREDRIERRQDLRENRREQLIERRDDRRGDRIEQRRERRQERIESRGNRGDTRRASGEQRRASEPRSERQRQQPGAGQGRGPPTAAGRGVRGGDGGGGRREGRGAS